MRLREFVLLSGLLLAWVEASATSEIYRCTASDGRVTYQQIPCPSASDGRAMDLPSSYPEVERAERDRLLQREAALDARLLKRLELEAAERIARDERISRERIAMIRAEAESDRIGGIPVVALGPMARPLPRHRRSDFNGAFPRPSGMARPWP